MMANFMYERARQGFLSACINWNGVLGTASPAVALVGSAYAANQVTDEFYSTLAAATIVASGILTAPSGSDGVADASDITFNSVALVNNTAASRIVLYNWTGTASTSRLLIYEDTATGLPVTPNGGNITITWDSGTCRIFRL